MLDNLLDVCVESAVILSTWEGREGKEEGREGGRGRKWGGRSIKEGRSSEHLSLPFFEELKAMKEAYRRK